MSAAVSTVDLLGAALDDYVARRWPVLWLHEPVAFGPKRGPDRARCSCGDPDCDAQGKHPRTRHGLSDASTDPAVIDSWRHRWPTANLGVRTGVAFDVLDVDGADALDELRAAAPDGEVPAGPRVLTGCGQHVYFEPTGEGNRVAMLPGCDWRGAGGYVVAPPSVHGTGTPYRWHPRYGRDWPLSPCPSWLLSIVRRETIVEKPATPSPVQEVSSAPKLWVPSSTSDDDTPARRRLAAVAGLVATAPEGTRNSRLFWASCRAGESIVHDGLDLAEAVTVLASAAATCGLGQVESERTIRSGVKAGVSGESRS